MSHPPFRIVLKTEPLTEEYLPAEFVSRHAQIRNLLEVITLPDTRGVVSWLHGPPGSGKSSAIRSVLHQFEEQQTRTAYVNCWSHRTLFSVLEAVLVDLGAITHVTREASFKFERLHAIAKQGVVVIALDEVDQMVSKERNALLYNLTRLPGARVVVATRSREMYVRLDPRIVSRLHPQFVSFTSYTRDELVAILRSRAVQALAPRTWRVADLNAIAAASQGDARISIQALRIAVQLAEKARSPRIRAIDIRSGLTQGRGVRRRYVLTGLSAHHRLLYEIVAAARSIHVEDAWRTFLSKSDELSLQKMKRRTFTTYKRALIMNHLIEEQQEGGRRNARTLRVIE